MSGVLLTEYNNENTGQGSADKFFIWFLVQIKQQQHYVLLALKLEVTGAPNTSL